MCGNFHRQYAYLYSLDVGVGRVEQQQAHDVFEPLAHSLDQRGHAALREVVLQSHIIHRIAQCLRLQVAFFWG